jgi:adenosylcobinamide-GDP ribazoletransferase
MAASRPRPLAGAALAVSFLTVLPVRLREPIPPLAAAAPWFPVVGALVGALAGAVRLVAEPAFGPTVASILALVVLVAVTGALHLDGLADCADGLGVRGDRARRLTVMREPTVGVFGTLAIVGWALLMVGALGGLTDGEAFRALLTAAVVGRWAALLHTAATPPARPDGLGAAFAVMTAGLLVASALAVAGALLVDGLGPGAAALAAAPVVALGVSAWARRRLGGRTGDTIGATVALTEVVVVLVLLGFAQA